MTSSVQFQDQEEDDELALPFWILFIGYPLTMIAAIYYPTEWWRLQAWPDLPILVLATIPYFVFMLRLKVCITRSYRPALIRRFVCLTIYTGMQFSAVPQVRIVSSAVLVGVVYGTLTHYVAARICPAYLTADSWSGFCDSRWRDGLKFENRLIQTLNPKLNAIVWGVFGTLPTSGYIGMILALVSLRSVHLDLRQLTAWMLLGGVLNALVAALDSIVLFSTLTPRYLYKEDTLEDAQNREAWISVELGNFAGCLALFASTTVLSVFLWHC